MFVLLLGLSVFVIIGIFSNNCNADIAKGKKLFTKKLKNVCGITGQAFAHKHTQAQWKKINEKGKMKSEIQKICPNAKDSAVKDKYLQHYFDFLHEYASDSGNIPSC